MTAKQPTGSGAIDEFLGRFPPETRAALEDLRQTIRAAAPDAEEAIAYGVPAFKYRGRSFVSFGATKNHCAFYVQSLAVMDAFKAELAGHDTSGGTVRFQPKEPLSTELVQRLVKARIAEIEAAAKK